MFPATAAREQLAQLASSDANDRVVMAMWAQCRLQSLPKTLACTELHAAVAHPWTVMYVKHFKSSRGWRPGSSAHFSASRGPTNSSVQACAHWLSSLLPLTAFLGGNRTVGCQRTTGVYSHFKNAIFQACMSVPLGALHTASLSMAWDCLYLHELLKHSPPCMSLPSFTIQSETVALLWGFQSSSAWTFSWRELNDLRSHWRIQLKSKLQYAQGRC